MTETLPRPFRERLKDDILAIAQRLIDEDGLAGLQARRIAAEAQCSVGTVYNVFGDLDGLILAANEMTLDAMGAPLAASCAASRGEPVADRLTALALAYMHFAFANQARWKAVFEHRPAASKELPGPYLEKRAHLLALIEDIIADEIPDAAVRMRAARALFAAVHGILALGLDNKLSTFDPAAVEAEIRFIVKAAAAGLRSVG